MVLLPIHIAAGITGIVSGYVAISALKGGALHRRSGMIFVYAMLTMAAFAVVLSAIKGQRLNAMQGVTTFYLVTTALLTVRPREQRSVWIDVSAMLVGLAAGLYEIKLGVEAMTSARRTIDGLPAPPMFVFGGVALAAAVGDLRVLRGRMLTGTHRLRRHLWRMCYALFVASGSFFLGQAQVFPKPIRIGPLLAIPALLPLVLMFYWLARMRPKGPRLGRGSDALGAALPNSAGARS